MKQAMGVRRVTRLYGPHKLAAAALFDVVAAGRCGNALLRRHGSVAEVARLGVAELCALGMAEAGAVRLAAAFELGRRASLPRRRRQAIQQPDDAYRWVAPHLKFAPRERFVVLVLDSQNRPCHICRAGEGGVNRCPVDVREVFGPALKARGTSVIVAHNHPSGDPAPSREDIALTSKLLQAGEILGVPLLDHLIVAANRFVSLATLGAMDLPNDQLVTDQLVAETGRAPNLLESRARD